jgi:hypothetical protein
MLELLRGKLPDLQEAQAQLNRSIMKCKDTLRHSSTDELVQKIEDFARQGKKIEEKLGFFKVIS